MHLITAQEVAGLNPAEVTKRGIVINNSPFYLYLKIKMKFLKPFLTLFLSVFISACDDGFKNDVQNEEIIINGGITSVDEIKPLLEKTDGVMIGRAAYHTPYLLADIEREIFNNDEVPTRQDVIEQLIPYVKEELKKGTRLNQIMRHTLGLFHGQTG